MSQHGFAPNVMRFGMNVVMDAINFGSAVMSDDKNNGHQVADLSTTPVGFEEA